ncbi:MAG: cell division protein FtsA [Bacteroidales bacterium]|nr:cell division protein FtsA [Candidatus Cryptobacteroides equifaecalis]
MQERYVATADLGSSKIAICVAKVLGRDIQVIYYKESPSDGIKYGSVFNPKRASDALRTAVNAAEDELKMKFSQIVVGLPRHNVRQESANATVQRSNPNSCITKEEISMLKSMAMESYPLNDESKEEIYGAVAQYFSADELVQQNENDVVGSPADTLTGNFKVFVGAKKASGNIDIMLNEIGIAPADKVFAPHAVAGAVLTDEEKDNGVALIEMGAGVTSVSIYKDRILRWYGSLQFAGRSITDDIKNECGFKTELAENIKLAYGACMPDKLQSMTEKILQINDNETGTYEHLSVKYLSEIITARTREIFEAVLYLIQESGFADKLRKGIVLTGGCANMANATIMLKEVSGYSVRQGYARKGLIVADDCPGIFETSATASVGLILNAAHNELLNCTGELNAAVQPEAAGSEQAQPAEGTLFTDDDTDIIKPEKEKKTRTKKTSLFSIKVEKVVNKMEDAIGGLFDDLK